MMEIAIRKASIDDLSLLMKWRMEVIHEVFNLAPDMDCNALERANQKYYEKSLPTEEHLACFACCETEIVGCGGICFSHEMPSPENPSGQCAYLMNIYTRPASRKQGIGRAIVRWLIAQALDRHITKIYLETSRKGQSMYQHMGFQLMSDMMKFESEEL